MGDAGGVAVQGLRLLGLRGVWLRAVFGGFNGFEALFSSSQDLKDA